MKIKGCVCYPKISENPNKPNNLPFVRPRSKTWMAAIFRSCIKLSASARIGHTRIDH